MSGGLIGPGGVQKSVIPRCVDRDMRSSGFQMDRVAEAIAERSRNIAV